MPRPTRATYPAARSLPLTPTPATAVGALAALAALVALAACAEGPAAPAEPTARPDAALVSGGGGGTTPPIDPCTIMYCPPGGGLLVASRYYQGDPNLGQHTGYNLVLLTSDGAIKKRLTDANAWDYLPALSPDRKKVAFGSTRHGGSVYVVNADGTGLTLLAKVDSAVVHHVHGVSWSPDGTKIVFSAQRNGQNDVFLVKPDGTGFTQVTNDAYFDMSPVFTPDGANLIISSTRGTGVPPASNRELWRITLAGAGVQRLTFTPQDERFPAFSPDGKSLLYSRQDYDAGTLTVLMADSAGANAKVMLTRPTATLMQHATFSPDGLWFAWRQQDPTTQRWVLWRAPVANPAAAVQFTSNAVNTDWPRWSN
jgi:Tol biopolymer transport system component